MISVFSPNPFLHLRKSIIINKLKHSTSQKTLLSTIPPFQPSSGTREPTNQKTPTKMCHINLFISMKCKHIQKSEYVECAQPNSHDPAFNTPKVPVLIPLAPSEPSNSSEALPNEEPCLKCQANDKGKAKGLKGKYAEWE